MDDRVQIYHRHWSEKRHRYCQFWFNAKPIKPDHIWSITMNADFVESEIIATDRDPYEVAVELLNKWKEAL